MPGIRRVSGPAGPRLLCIALLLAHAGCGGDGGTEPEGTEGDLFLRFLANGEQVEYTNAASLFAAFSTTTGQSNLVVTGYDAETNVGLQIYNEGGVGVGTYSGYDIVNSILVGTLMHYDTGAIEYTTDPSASGAVTITVSEITDTRVRGTFSGKLVETGQPDVQVTQGSFLVQRAN